MTAAAIVFYLVILNSHGASPIAMESRDACVLAANRMADAMGAGYPWCVGTDGSVYRSIKKEWQK